MFNIQIILPGCRRRPLHLAVRKNSMAKKRAAKPTPPDQPRTSITTDRFARLNLLLSLLADSPRPRDELVRRLELDVRGFYRDLEVLRQAGIPVELRQGRYHLDDTLDGARARLPFP